MNCSILDEACSRCESGIRELHILVETIGIEDRAYVLLLILLLAKLIARISTRDETGPSACHDHLIAR